MQTEELEMFPLPVHVTTLDNGLTIFTVDNGSRFVNVELVVRVGWAQEEFPETQGVAHFLEHAISTTEGVTTAHAMHRELTMRGVDSNACTSPGMTTYFLDSGYAEELEDVLSVLFGQVFLLPLNDNAVLIEREPILQERLEQANQMDLFSCNVRAQMFPGFGRLAWPTLGTGETIMEITMSGLREFRSKWYGTQNSAIIVVGGVEHGEVVRIASGMQLPLAKETAERFVCGGREAVRKHHYVEGAPGQVYFFTGQPRTQLDAMAMKYIHSVLFSPTFGIIYTELREGLGMYGLSVDAIEAPIDLQSWVMPAEQKIHDRVERVVYRGVRRLIRNEVPREILNAALAVSRRRLLRAVDMLESKVCHHLWMDLLKQAFLTGGFVDVPDLAELERVTSRDLRRVARKYLDPKHMSTFFLSSPVDKT